MYKIYPTAKIPDMKNVEIGDHSVIEDFVLLYSSKIEIGKYVEIGTGTKIVGKGELYIKDFVTISPNCVIITSTPDIHKELSVSSMIPDSVRKPIIGTVTINSHVFIGAESVILPNVTIQERCVIGANSTVLSNSVLDPNSVYVGSPVKKVGVRFR